MLVPKGLIRAHCDYGPLWLWPTVILAHCDYGPVSLWQFYLSVTFIWWISLNWNIRGSWSLMGSIISAFYCPRLQQVKDFINLQVRISVFAVIQLMMNTCACLSSALCWHAAVLRLWPEEHRPLLLISGESSGEVNVFFGIKSPILSVWRSALIPLIAATAKCIKEAINVG